jgi:hypothetical protein
MDARCEGRLTNRKSELVRDNWHQGRLQAHESNTGDKTATRGVWVEHIQGTATVCVHLWTYQIGYHVHEGIATQKFRRPLVRQTDFVIYSTAREEVVWCKDTYSLSQLVKSQEQTYHVQRNK